MKTLDSTEVIESLGMPYLHDLSTLGALSDEVVIDLLQNGHIRQVEKGEILCQYGMEVTGFSVVLKGDIAFYKHCEGKDVPRNLRISPLCSLRAIERPVARKAVQRNVWTFPNCLTKQVAVIEPALRGFQSDLISVLTIFDRQPVCLKLACPLGTLP